MNIKASHLLDHIPGLDSYETFLLYTSSNGWNLKNQIEIHPEVYGTYVLKNTTAKKDKQVLIYSVSEDENVLEQHYNKILSKIMKGNNICKNYRKDSKYLHAGLYKDLFLYLFRHNNYLLIGYCSKSDANDLMVTLRDLKVAKS